MAHNQNFVWQVQDNNEDEEVKSRAINESQDEYGLANQSPPAHLGMLDLNDHNRLSERSNQQRIIEMQKQIKQELVNLEADESNENRTSEIEIPGD